MEQTTAETSWTPPNHYIRCTKCRLNFCTQRQTATGERFCVSCYAEMAHVEREEMRAARRAAKAAGQDPNVVVPEQGKLWTRIAVVAAKCCVCKAKSAEHLCRECGGDTTCGRCFAAVHKNPKFKHHTNHESLVYADTAVEGM
ncbi:Aste57867_4950 [Aphanomyces stellatus]|uniref:Aste57867_4950 protein n=1 Tax=Aphanomyces stellatus TaxID=120398 RepID=A0A485KG50_9STRA|nr:hypothetical protein As57867_004937 [Aphanomyces stellatus]VFT82038.1 Aste57867_4950 [Aphanomyces stellatus]